MYDELNVNVVTGIHCVAKCRIATFLVFAFFLLSSLLFSFPFYIKSITIPSVGKYVFINKFAC